MKIVEVSSQASDKILDLTRRAYRLIPVNKYLFVCPNSMWEKLKGTLKNLASDVTGRYEFRLQERSMILVKEKIKSAEMMGDDKVRVKFNHNNQLVGKLLMTGGVCPFCGETKLTFLSFEKDSSTVCLSCNRNIVIINNDSSHDFQKLFPEIYKVV